VTIYRVPFHGESIRKVIDIGIRDITNAFVVLKRGPIDYNKT